MNKNSKKYKNVIKIQKNGGKKTVKTQNLSFSTKNLAQVFTKYLILRVISFCYEANFVEVNVMFLFGDPRKRKFRSSVQIKGEVRTVLGKDVFYRLYEVRRAGFKSYAINISAAGESQTCSFGTDKRAAVEMFVLIVEGTVTPCSLKYIAEDFRGGRAKMLK